MKQTFILIHQEARNRALEAVKSAPDGLVVTIGESTRNLDQNAKFHAICEDVAKSGVKWLGKPRTAQEWKTLFVSGHAIATGNQAEVIAGLEGEYLNIRESTARMGKKRASSLIEYCLAFCATNGVTLRYLDQYTDSKTDL